MRRVIESGVVLGVILILGGVLFLSLGRDGDQAGAAWRSEFAQQSECVQGKYAEEECVRLGAVQDYGGEDEAAIGGGVAESGGLPFGEMSETASAPTRGLAYGMQGMAGTAGVPTGRFSYLYAGRQLARFDGTNIQFVHGDHLGTGAARTAADGSVMESSRQLPFGTQLGAVSRETDFTGKKMDAPTHLNYFNARAYNPPVGRFLQADLVLHTAASNYAYVDNNPLTTFDPTGQFSIDWNKVKMKVGMGLITAATFVGYGQDATQLMFAETVIPLLLFGAEEAVGEFVVGPLAEKAFNGLAGRGVSQSNLVLIGGLCAACTAFSGRSANKVGNIAEEAAAGAGQSATRRATGEIRGHGTGRIGRGAANAASDYYQRRVKEIMTPHATTNIQTRKLPEGTEKLPNPSEDVWVHRGELPGLVKEFDRLGIYHREVESHLGGYRQGPAIAHGHASGRLEVGAEWERLHIMITDDPADPRLFSTTSGFRSEAYREDFPRVIGEPNVGSR